MELKFEWDENKNSTNKTKHNISFEEAKTAFYDIDAMQYYDPEHSTLEHRYILLGMSSQLKTLVVCHCLKEQDSLIRIISARVANKKEQQAYWSLKL
ncbi:MAG: BrnT family toxin [Gammaproteobacteria bacterium]|nr:MAG: BrnT family toxin [Gammaproteobacteria bacterium]